MASITEILGTDSLSSSRITINENFAALNDDIFNVQNFLDVDTATLQNLTSLTTGELNVSTGGTNIITADSATIEINVDSTFAGESTEVVIEGIFRKSSRKGSSATPHDIANDGTISTGFSYLTYIINSDLTDFPTGNPGQEVTFINAFAGALTLNDSSGNTVFSNSTLDAVNSTLTLRWHVDRWYVVAGYNYTVNV